MRTAGFVLVFKSGGRDKILTLKKIFLLKLKHDINSTRISWINENSWNMKSVITLEKVKTPAYHNICFDLSVGSDGGLMSNGGPISLIHSRKLGESIQKAAW